MSTRAKLLYNGERYYDLELQAIANKELLSYKAQLEYYTLDRERQMLKIYGRTVASKILVEIPFSALHLYKAQPKGRKKNIDNPNEVTINGKKYTKEQLMKIGEEVASLWGASCYSYKVNKKEKLVCYDCIEHGEKFVANVSFGELGDYDYIL